MDPSAVKEFYNKTRFDPILPIKKGNINFIKQLNR